MKKIVIFVLLVLLLPSISSAAFSDLDANHWAKPDIEELSATGIITGRPDGTFDPDATVTRAEFAAIMSRMFPQTPSKTNTTPAFSDVSPEDWFYDAVMKAARSGLITGVDEEHFLPNSPISRQDSAVLMTRYLEANEYLFFPTQRWWWFDDQADIQAYATHAVGRLFSNNIINGYDNGRFLPQNHIRRSEGAALANRVYTLFYKAKSLDDYCEKLDGSTVTEPLSVAIMAQQLSLGQYRADAIISHNKTDTAIKNVIDGKKDLALVTYPSDENLAYAKSKGVELAILPIVNDAFVFLVNADNPVESLTIQQVKDIYSGKITNWNQVGGNDMEIMPLQRNATSGSQSGMLDFMGDTTISVPFVDANIVGAMGQLIEKVESEPSAIGYSYYYYANNMYMTRSKLIALEGYKPSETSVKNETYPSNTKYYAVFRTTEEEDSFARNFTEYILSPKGQITASAYGYVPLSESQIMPLPKPGTGGFIKPDVSKPFSLTDICKRLAVSYSATYLPGKLLNDYFNIDYGVELTLHDEGDYITKYVIDGYSNISIGLHPSDEMLKYATEKGVELEIVPIFEDKLVFVTNTNNPVNELTSQQLRDICTLKIKNWSDVGGYDKRIVLNGDDTSEGGDIMETTLCLFDFLNISEIYSRDIYNDPNYYSDQTGYYDTYLSYIPYTDYMRASYIGHKMLSIDGKDPLSDDYPAKIAFYAIMRKSEPKDSFARNMLKFLQSTEGTAILRELGYIPIK